MIMREAWLETVSLAENFVDRYNTVNSDTKSSSLIHNHGTAQNGGRTRSCRAFEAYHNYLNPATGGSALIGDAGGPGLVWGNTLSRLSAVFLAVGDRTERYSRSLLIKSRHLEGMGILRNWNSESKRSHFKLG